MWENIMIGVALQRRNAEFIHWHYWPELYKG